MLKTSVILRLIAIKEISIKSASNTEFTNIKMKEYFVLRLTNKLYLPIFFLIGTAVTSNSFAEPIPVGTVLITKGNVVAIGPSNQKRILSRGSKIYAGEKIVTAEGSDVQIRYSDNGLVSIKPKGEYQINSYEYKGPKDKKANLAATLLKGQMHALTGAIAKENPKGYTVKTKLATIAITGTDFWTQIMDKVQLLEVFRGTVEFMARGGSIAVGLNAPYSAAMVTSTSGIPVGFPTAPAFFSNPENTSQDELENQVNDTLMISSFYDSYKLGLDPQLLSENLDQPQSLALDGDLFEEYDEEEDDHY
jgi:hypothetical protein